MAQNIIIFVAVALLTGGVIGYYFRLLIMLQRKDSIELDIKKMHFSAKEKARKIIEDGEKKVLEKKKTSREELQERERTNREKEERLIKKEGLLDERQFNIDKNEASLKERLQKTEELAKENKLERHRVVRNLERVADLSEEAARRELFRALEKKHEEDIFMRIQKLETTGFEQLKQKAHEILTTAIHRLGNSTAPEIMTSIVTLSSEDEKGKIIGKEGRNIRAFEKAAGVELVVDDTPGSVLISAFDPVRRHIAKNALEGLIEDGRIHPAKIEKCLRKAEKNMAGTIAQKGAEAAYECGVLNLDPRITAILGRLYFRTSYGQNVLQHSIEMAHIAGMIAKELGADSQIAKTGALLHDIGKAVDHNVQGTHVEIGKRILEKFGADPLVIKAMQSHHEEYPYETPESVIVQVADAISGSRPGARRDSVENYLQRLTELEALANSFDGVERSYALQAGREVRVFVAPDNISDIDAQKIARELALRIEEDLRYPGEIKVSVMRETKYIEYAR